MRSIPKLLKLLTSCCLFASSFWLATPAALVAQSNSAEVFFFPDRLFDKKLLTDAKFLSLGSKLLLVNYDGKMIFFEPGSGFEEAQVPLAGDANSIFVTAVTKDSNNNLYVQGTFGLISPIDANRDFIAKFSTDRKWSFFPLPKNLGLSGSLVALSDGTLIAGTLSQLDPASNIFTRSLIKIKSDQVSYISGTELDRNVAGLWYQGIVNPKDEAMFVNTNTGKILIIGADDSLKSYQVPTSIYNIGVDQEDRFWYSRRDIGFLESADCFGYISHSNEVRDFCIPYFFSIGGGDFTLNPLGEFWNVNQSYLGLRFTSSEKVIQGKFVVPAGKNLGIGPTFSRFTIDSKGTFWGLGQDYQRTRLFFQRFDRLPKDFKVRTRRLSFNGKSVTFKAYANREGGPFNDYRRWASFNVMVFGSNDPFFDSSDPVRREQRVDFFPQSTTTKRNIFSVKLPRTPHYLFACIDCSPDLPFEVKQKRTIRLR